MLEEYQAGTARAFIEASGWESRNSGDEIKLKTCPFCGRDDYRFFLNDQTGVYLCHHASCSQKGNWYQFTRALGIEHAPAPTRNTRTESRDKAKKAHPASAMDPYTESLLVDGDGLAYIAARGITVDTARAWKLGLKTEDNGSKWLMIPYITTAQQISDIKYRSISEKKFRRKGGGESVLFGEHWLTSTSKPETLYITEAEIDAITLWQHGFTPVVSATNGAGSFAARWYDLIEQADPERIVVVYDNDVAGQQGAERILKKFDHRSVVNVVLPDGTKDANEYFAIYGVDDFNTLIGEAKPAEDIPHVITLSRVLDALEERLFTGTAGCDGYASQFKAINDMIAGGYWLGGMTTITGVAGAGKTSLLTQEAIHFASQDVPVYLLNLEMTEEMMLRKIIEHKTHVPILRQTLKDIQAFRPSAERMPVYLGYGIRNIKKMEDTIRKAVKRYDIKVVGIDNVNLMTRGARDVNQATAEVTGLLKALAVDLRIPIFLIAQPRKFDDDDRMMTMNDVKDSQSIVADSDNVIAIWRRRIISKGNEEDFHGGYSPFCTVRVDKARYGPGGETVLLFQGEISTFRELNTDERERLADMRRQSIGNKPQRKSYAGYES